jgi:hypothetical protein
MSQKTIAIFLMVAIALISSVSAEYWSSNVDTNSSHWSIYRQSSNISLNLSGSVVGEISPVESHGRILKPCQSYYEEIGANDVRLRERTSAQEGSYKSADEIEMQSTVYPNGIEILVDKPIGTDLYTIEYKNEQWPVFIKASRAIAYSGQQINDRDFEGNNGDFAGTSFLYNRELSKEQMTVMWLQRMNATVLATDNSILVAEFMPTKYLGYLVRANSTGVADLSYRLRDYRYDVKHQNYPALSEGDERYYGTYDLSRKIEMRSSFENLESEDSRLPCCANGRNGMGYFDQTGIGTEANRIFDCTCYKETVKT